MQALPVLEGVAPAEILDHLRHFARDWLNPRMRQLAGRAPFPLALISHRGRRSGRRYTAPVAAHRHGDTLIVPLTYGTRADWVQNVWTHQRAAARWHGKVLTLERPRLLTALEAMPRLPLWFRTAVRIIGMRWFLELRIVSAESTES